MPSPKRAAPQVLPQPSPRHLPADSSAPADQRTDQSAQGGSQPLFTADAAFSDAAFSDAAFSDAAFSPKAAAPKDPLATLNAPQRACVEHGDGPLLVLAGPGSGKTRTLVHRVAHLLTRGIDASQILLLTFSRRAAAEMLRRVDHALRDFAEAGLTRIGPGVQRAMWGGTFHAMATRLLHMYGSAVGLGPAFVVHDRSDSEDLLDLVRTELGLTTAEKRFPRKETALSIYSRCVNSGRPLTEVVAQHFPWCQPHLEELKQLFDGYVAQKESSCCLDYDDLLLFFLALVQSRLAGPKIRQQFRAVLVDEYQDTNQLQADILRALCPGGQGLTVVGDDAQSIYGFRAATVRNILDFPQHFPGAAVIKLEQNYRSTQAILQATNSVIAEGTEQFAKTMWTDRAGGTPPQLVNCRDEDEQADYIAGKVLERRESGTALRQQAVLFRTAHHSAVLEAELSRRRVPFVKFGGLKFLESGHVKDLFSVLRLGYNRQDVVAGCRVLNLIPGIGPKTARMIMARLTAAGGNLDCLQQGPSKAACPKIWQHLVQTLRFLSEREREVSAQVHCARVWYAPLLEEKYDQPTARLQDLEQLELMAARFADLESMLNEMALDPPNSTADFAGPPLLDEDYLILSTLHSAKGLEWDAVTIMHASDGNIPSDMATGSADQIEEERRLFYVGLTRARRSLTVCVPQRYYHFSRGSRRDQHGYGLVTRFLSAKTRALFSQENAAPAQATPGKAALSGPHTSLQVRQGIKKLWQ